MTTSERRAVARYEHEQRRIQEDVVTLLGELEAERLNRSHHTQMAGFFEDIGAGEDAIQAAIANAADSLERIDGLMIEIENLRQRAEVAR